MAFKRRYFLKKRFDDFTFITWNTFEITYVSRMYFGNNDDGWAAKRGLFIGAIPIPFTKRSYDVWIAFGRVKLVEWVRIRQFDPI